MRFYIETDRLIMRDLMPDDDKGMFALDSDAEVHRYIGGRPVRTIAESRNVIAIIRRQYETNGIGRLAVIEKRSGNFIGWSGLKLMTEPVNGHKDYLDVGYRFIQQYWGKGYAKETAKASVAMAWHTLHAQELFGIANTQNIASRKVLESAGLRFVHTFDYDGEPHAWYNLKRGEEQSLIT